MTEFPVTPSGRAIEAALARPIPISSLLATLLFGSLIPGGVSAQNPGDQGGRSPPVNLGPVISSSARDAEPTFTADGDSMYFNCVDREAGAGYDICASNGSAASGRSPRSSDHPSAPSIWRWSPFSLRTAGNCTS